MKIDEIQCIKELRNGSYQAFTQIYEAYADRLYSFVLKQLKNRSLAQDIVQDTFLRPVSYTHLDVYKRQLLPRVP